MIGVATLFVTVTEVQKTFFEVGWIGAGIRGRAGGGNYLEPHNFGFSPLKR